MEAQCDHANRGLNEVRQEQRRRSSIARTSKVWNCTVQAATSPASDCDSDAESERKVKRNTRRSRASCGNSRADASGAMAHASTLDSIRLLEKPDLQMQNELHLADLADTLEWDLGVAQALRQLKAQQILQQIAIDTRRDKHRIESVRRTHRRGSNSVQTEMTRVLKRQNTRHDEGMKAAETLGLKGRNRERAADGERQARTQRISSTASLVNDRLGLDIGKAEEAKGCTNGAAKPTTSARQQKTARTAREEFVEKAKRVFSKKPNLSFDTSPARSKTRTRSRRTLFEGLASTAEMTKERWYSIHPASRVAQSWLTIANLCSTISCILAPVEIAQLPLSDDYVFCLKIVHLTLDYFSIAHVLFHFVLAYEDDLLDILVTSPYDVALRYIKSFFFVDAISALPVVSIVLDHQMKQSLQFDVLLCVCRLTRGVNVFVSRNNTIDVLAAHSLKINPSLSTLMRSVMLLLLIWHVNACAYLAVAHASVNQPKNLAPFDEWSPSEHQMNFNSTAVLYAQAWQFAVDVSALGNVPQPCNLHQHVFTQIASVIGILSMTLVVGSAAAAVGDLQQQQNQLALKLRSVDCYLSYKRIPVTLRTRILSFYRFQHASMSNVDVENTLSGLPRALRLQVSLTTHKSIFVQLPLFWLCSETEILTIVQRLKPCIVLPGETLVKQHVVGVGLFLLTRGAVEVLQDNALVVVLLAVAAFGEHSLQNARSNVSVRALRFCEVSVLLSDDWAQIEHMNRNVSKWLSLYLQERDRKLEDPIIRRQSLQTKTAASKSVSANAWSNAEDELAQQTYRTRRMLRSSINARLTARRLLSMRKKNTTPGRGWLEA